MSLRRLDPIRPGDRFDVAGEEWVVSALEEPSIVVRMTRLRDGAIRLFSALELRDGLHVRKIQLDRPA